MVSFCPLPFAERHPHFCPGPNSGDQTHRPGRKETEPRVVDPYHLANINGEWFLFAHCHLRNDIRTFVPARILEIKPTGRAVKKPSRASSTPITWPTSTANGFFLPTAICGTTSALLSRPEFWRSN